MTSLSYRRLYRRDSGRNGAAARLLHSEPALISRSALFRQAASSVACAWRGTRYASRSTASSEQPASLGSLPVVVLSAWTQLIKVYDQSSATRPAARRPARRWR